jgi:soluble lytic murein transglycosylase
MKMRRLTVSLILASVAALAGAPAPAQTEAQGAALAQALDEARLGNWEEAKTLASQARDPVADEIILWTRLRDGVGEFEEFEEFLTRNPGWPGLSRLRRQGERQMSVKLPPDGVLVYFDNALPRSGTGSLRYAAALNALERPDDAKAEIARAWVGMSLSLVQQKAMLELWPDVIASLHQERLDMLLWRGWTKEAEAMLPLVSADWQALARARIAVRRDTDGLTGLIRAVPKDLKDDPGLAYERYLYRTGKGRWEEAETWMLEHSDSAEMLGLPDLWMPRRANLARQALQRGEVEAAYQIAANNFGESGGAFADSEWLAGFIALMRMKDPERAIPHFERFQAAVATPISLGRGGFWLGLAHERAGNADEAQKAYAEGAKHQTSFYGQLAAARGDIDADARLAGETRPPEWKDEAFATSSVAQAARLLIAAGDDVAAARFLRQIAEDQPAATRAQVAQMAIDMDRVHIGIRIAKDAARKGIVLPDQYYPLAKIDGETWAVPTEFALAIARQESELNPKAASDAGARGLMQLLPGTAEAVARDLDITFDLKRLSRDPLYNARLGTEYLARNLKRYRGSYILATAAYNAGPGRVNKWIEEFGDPRKPDVDPITWIESIPYSETRNYVMRVMEALHVYRARLTGKAAPIRLVDDINRTG